MKKTKRRSGRTSSRASSSRRRRSSTYHATSRAERYNQKQTSRRARSSGSRQNKSSGGGSTSTRQRDKSGGGHRRKSISQKRSRNSGSKKQQAVENHLDPRYYSEQSSGSVYDSQAQEGSSYSEQEFAYNNYDDLHCGQQRYKSGDYINGRGYDTATSKQLQQHKYTGQHRSGRFGGAAGTTARGTGAVGSASHSRGRNYTLPASTSKLSKSASQTLSKLERLAIRTRKTLWYVSVLQIPVLLWVFLASTIASQDGCPILTDRVLNHAQKIDWGFVFVSSTFTQGQWLFVGQWQLAAFDPNSNRAKLWNFKTYFGSQGWERELMLSAFGVGTLLFLATFFTVGFVILYLYTKKREQNKSKNGYGYKTTTNYLVFDLNWSILQLAAGGTTVCLIGNMLLIMYMVLTGYRTIVESPGCRVSFGMGFSVLLGCTVLAAMSFAMVYSTKSVIEKACRRNNFEALANGSTSALLDQSLTSNSSEGEDSADSSLSSSEKEQYPYYTATGKPNYQRLQQNLISGGTGGRPYGYGVAGGGGNYYYGAGRGGAAAGYTTTTRRQYVMV
ncbi:unnamed protein product [Amoebophrya sp. A120]|nr:unnamed protein product [Amoebophrya sp. A120]|eukprot:GSA120T00010487001.1